MNYMLQGNPNYAAEVFEVTELITYPELDNLVGIVTPSGFTALVSKNFELGTTVVLFPPETQLTEGFARKHNLYAKAEMNADPTAKGYLGKNGRVRAIRLRGVTSNALVLKAETVGLQGASVGDLFDTIDGELICKKFVVPTKAPQVQAQAQADVWERVEAKYLPQHIDTAMYGRNMEQVDGAPHVVVTQKLHGTSIRIGHTLVRRKLSRWERLLKRFGVKVAETEYDYVYGSRRVIKSDTSQNFYGEDLWTKYGQVYAPLVPKNVILYGELIGWVNETVPIQQGYTYNLPPGEAELYVYRVAVVSADGVLYDLPWEGVKAFCRDRGIKYVPQFYQGADLGKTAYDSFLDVRYYRTPTLQEVAVPLSDPNTVDEGICIRLEGQTPTVFKHKAPLFYEHETKLLDQEQEILS